MAKNQTIFQNEKVRKKRKIHEDDEVEKMSAILDIMSVKKKLRMTHTDIQVMYNACIENDIDEIKLILKNHLVEPSIVFQNDAKQTPLIISIIYGSTDVASILIHSKVAEINSVDAYGKTALYYASKFDNEIIVKLLLRYRVIDKTQMIIESPKMQKIFNSMINGTFKKKSQKDSSPRVKLENDQSKFRKSLGIIYNNCCVFTGAPIAECDHQFISSPKQFGEKGYSTDNGILVSKYLNRVFYKKGKISLDKDSILVLNPDFILIKVITVEPEINYLNGKMIKIQKKSIPFIK